MQAEQLFTSFTLHEVHGDCADTHNFVAVFKHLGAEQVRHCEALSLQFIQFDTVQVMQFEDMAPF
jgi:hypothetical protein